MQAYTKKRVTSQLLSNHKQTKHEWMQDLYSGLNSIIQNGMFLLESISAGVLSHKWEDLCVILTHKRTHRKLP